MADAPQVAYGDAHLESYGAQHRAAHKEGVYVYPEVVEDEPKRSGTILGLRRRNFWILVAFIAVIACATIGGSVGGSLAVRNRGSSSVPAASASVTSATSTTASSQSSTSTAASSTSATSSFYVPPPAASVSSIDISCPSSLKDYNGKSYSCIAARELDGGDITGISAYSLQQCLDACSTMNAVNGSTICKAVVLSRDLAFFYKGNKGANCWLKSQSTLQLTNQGSTVAVLNT